MYSRAIRYTYTIHIGNNKVMGGNSALIAMGVINKKVSAGCNSRSNQIDTEMINYAIKC